MALIRSNRSKNWGRKLSLAWLKLTVAPLRFMTTRKIYLEIQLHNLFANNRVLNRMSLSILGNFCTRLSEMLEAKKARIPFWNNLSISNIITATLCYLISKCFPAESVPRCMSSLFSTVPFTNQKTGSVYQCRG